MADRTQEFRDVAVGTTLGEDVLLLQNMQFTEQLGRPFQGELNLYSEVDDKIDFSKIIGTDMTVRLERGDTGTRYFNGYISRFVQSSRTGRIARYHATIVPWIWFLTRTSDCRIFQHQKIPDIVQAILKEKGFTDVEAELTGTYTAKDYCVQYRETDFNFISRLLEREGIYYYFKHENGKHTMVLADSPSAHKAYPAYATIPYRAVSSDANREYISDWTIEQTVEPGLYSLNDFDFTAPKKSLLAKAQATATYAQSDHEIYDYPGEYAKPAEGQEYSKIRIEELQAQQEVVSASSDAMGISAGFTFSLTDPPRDDQADEHLITSASVQITGDHFDAGNGSAGSGGGGTMFSAHFTAIKSKTQFRPPRITPKPIMQGPQTAIIVGKKGEEIWTDEYGRVKVQFHWDRYNKADENSSCWIRVSQEWAGKKWGTIHLPRIGQEVIVDFLEGDPDQPIITGRVYNGDNKPPYPLPAQATKSTTKSLSSKGGGGFNEIRFEDKKGSEQVFIHAQHNMDVHVNASHMESVGGSKHLTVGGEKDGVRHGSLSELVHKDHNVYIKESRNEKIGGNVQQLIGQGDGPGGNLDLYIDKQRTEYVGEGYDLHVKGNRQEKIDGEQALTIGGSQQEKIGMKHAVDAGQEIHLKAGMNVTIEAGVQLTIKAAGGFIDIGPAGVTIQGTMVLINSGGAAGSGSGSSPTAPKDALIAAPVAPSAADNDKAGALQETQAPEVHKVQKFDVQHIKVADYKPIPLTDTGGDVITTSPDYKTCPQSVKNDIKNKEFTPQEKQDVDDAVQQFQPLMQCSNQPIKAIARANKGITKDEKGCVAETDTMGEWFPDQGTLVLTDAAGSGSDFPNDPSKQLKATTLHELTHSLDRFDPRTCTSYKNPDDNPLMKEWRKTAGWNGAGDHLTETPGNKAPTDYAKKNADEDFSESVMLYKYDPDKLKAASPARYDFINKLYGGQ